MAARTAFRLALWLITDGFCARRKRCAGLMSVQSADRCALAGCSTACPIAGLDSPEFLIAGTANCPPAARITGDGPMRGGAHGRAARRTVNATVLHMHMKR